MSAQREKELARQRAERQTARRAAAAARRKQRNAVIASVLAVLLVAAAVGVLATSLDRDGSTSDTASAPAGPCRYLPAGPAAKKVGTPPSEGVETDGTYTATMATSVGAIAFEMDAAKAPCTVNSLRSLAHQSFFDDTACHRLTSQSIFVLQCGDPLGSGRGGPGYAFDSENLEGATYPRGTVAMANSGAPGTNGSQFFLVYQDSQLPPQYTPFGRVTRGLDLIDRVAKAGSTPPGDGKPKTPVQVRTLRVSACPAPLPVLAPARGGP